MGYIVYFNAFKAKTIINSPYNVRQDLLANRIIRGKILDKNGQVLAKTTVKEDGKEQREYPYGDLYAHVVGYASKGKAGLESKENFNLLTSNAFILEKIMKEFKGEKNIGDNVVTTLDTNLQQAAYDALGDNKGAVVVMEADTGKILSLVSKPTFDPNHVAENWLELNQDKNSVMLNRAMQGKYAPGSTFKIVTALEYIRENKDYDSYQYKCTGKIEHNGTVIHCNNKKVHGLQDLRSSFANSCNGSFSNIGLQLDISKYEKTAKQLLFNEDLPSPLMYSASKFILSPKDPSSEVMMTAMGQGKTQVSPYHMALITSSIANGGKLMKPYLVDKIVNYSGTTVTKNMPEEYGTLMTREEATQLTEYMKSVVEEGTAKTLNGQGYSVAGKTGTAEYSIDKEKVHSWFVGFTNVDNPELVISVVVEGSDSTGTKAVNVAKKVFNSYY
ncbi:peptidoglycan D,D-transpeptidase FtsI family protein [Faecalimonas sp.]